jgi:hypothetical protein
MFLRSNLSSFAAACARAASLLAVLALASCGGGGGCGSATACKTAAGTSGTNSIAPVTAASAVSVSIGTDGTLSPDAVSALKYSKKFVVTVVDQAGRPVLGAQVTPHIEMLAFAKGWVDRDPTTFETKPNGDHHFFCAAEDVNNNDVLDPGEDLNGDGILTPPRSTVVIVATNNTDLTDATGSVVFELQYPKNYATWIVPTLVVKASVTGTEGSAKLDYLTSFVAGDEKTASTPFVFSPFSTTLTTTPSCTDNL